jgi:hypothetical protein
MAKELQPDYRKLIKRIELDLPLVGFYDAPDPKPFEPLVKPKEGNCVFSFYKNWLRGETLHIAKSHYGCGGAGRWMCGIEIRAKEDFIKFLVDDEGLKASHELMEKWVDSSKLYRVTHPNIFIGPLKEAQWKYLKSVTFFVNPDQLSTLMVGAQYHSSPDDPPPVIAPFGAGCMELLPFKDLSVPQAAIGATDIAMRRHLPPNILAFSVTKPMFGRLCSLDERSFLYKPFLQTLKKARATQSK